jgi:hypothetical protein
VLVEGFSKYAVRARSASEAPLGGGSPFDRAPQGTAVTESHGLSSRTDTHPAQESEQDRGCEILAAPVGRTPNGDSNRSTAQLVGRTPGDLIVVLDGESSLIGSLTRVRIQRATSLTMFGQFERTNSVARADRARPVPAHRALPQLSPSA